MQGGTRREVHSGEAAWFWLLILVDYWSRNVLVAAEAVDVPEAEEEQAAPEAQGEAPAERAVPVAEVALEERAEPGGQAELAAEEAREGPAVQGARAEQVEELPGEVVAG